MNDFANKTLVPPKKTKLVVHYTDSKGQPRIKGGPGLKLSQSYPLRFFGANLQLWGFFGEPTHLPTFKSEYAFKAIILQCLVFSVGRQTIWFGKEYH